MHNYRVGIDPDLSRSGLAIIKYIPFGKPEIIYLTTETFTELKNQIKLIYKLANTENAKCMVFLEAGWLNKKSNYHTAFNKNIAAKIGKNVGENHAVGKLIEESLIENNISYKLVKPTNKKWDADMFKKITGCLIRTNAEQRDAVRVAWL